MSLINPQDRLLQSLEQAHLVSSSLAATMKMADDAPTPPNMPPGFFRSLATVPQFAVFLNARESNLVAAGSALETALAPAVTAIAAITKSTTPSELQANVQAFLAVSESTQAAVRAVPSGHGNGTPEQVVAEFKSDFILTLTVTMTGHARLVELVSTWERDSQTRARRHSPGGKDYYDIHTFEVVHEDGPDRVHMEYLRAAVEAGMATFVPGEGIRETEYTPPIQTALYGQWFTYIHSLWEDTYRGRLAQAYGPAPDGQPWTAGDLRSPFFSDITKIRNDFVHSAGKAGRCLKNTIITGFTRGAQISLTPTQMMDLITHFPDQDLLTPPATRSGPVTRTALAWTASRELADRMRAVVKANGVRGEVAVDEAVQLWIDAQEQQHR